MPRRSLPPSSCVCFADRERHFAAVYDEGSKIMSGNEYNEYRSKLALKYRGANPRDNDEEICRVLRALEAMLSGRRSGREVSEKSIRGGYHECDEGEAIGELRDRIEELEGACPHAGGSDRKMKKWGHDLLDTAFNGFMWGCRVRLACVHRE